MSSVSTTFKVHYNTKIGGPIRPSWGMHHGLWGDRRPVQWSIEREGRGATAAQKDA